MKAVFCTTNLLLATWLVIFAAPKFQASEKTCRTGDIKVSQVLVGTWRNELGSKLEILAAEEGQFNGFYQTSVGTADGKYDLIGRYYTGCDSSFTLGW